MGAVNFYLLGSPRLERDGKPVQVDTRKAIALLAYLVITGKQHSRDTMAALLWPDYSQSNARAALRRTLSALHRSSGVPLVEASREVLELSPRADLWVDVNDFYRSLRECDTHRHPHGQVCPDCLPNLERSVQLYSDHFMSGFTLRDSIEFDDWQFMQSESLRRELAGALERLVVGYTAVERYDDAIRYAQRWLSLDALHEPAHRQLMQLYSLAGKRSAALRQYQECVRILEKELGVRPLEETSRLYQDIKDMRGIWGQEYSGKRDGSKVQPTGTSLGVAASPVAMAPNMGQDLLHKQVSRLPFVGREAEWAAVQQIYSSISHDSFFLVLEGEAGMGRTRLAEEFLSSVRLRGAATIQARCYPGENNLAYAPFVEGLSNAIDQPGREGWSSHVLPQWLSEAARLLPGISRLGVDLPPVPPAESPGAQTRFFEGLSHVILALIGQPPQGVTLPGGELPGVLFLDDLEWADEATLDLLTYFVRRSRGQPVLILATWRGENIGSGHRLRKLLAETERSGRGAVLILSRLTKEAVGELVRAALPGASNPAGITPAGFIPTADFSQRLYLETEGLPFFITEYLATLRNEITPGDPLGGATTWNGEEAWPVPHGVRDLLRSRLEPIGETGIQLLQAAAVIGRSFDFDTLHEVSGRTDVETIITLENLMGCGLIRESLPGNGGGSQDSLRSLTYDFSHEKLRSFVYNETSLARRRLLHVRTAEALVSHARGRYELPSLAGSIASHYKQGGRAREGAEYYRLAGETARSLYANAEALAHFQSALALGYPDAPGLNEDIGGMYTLLGDYSAAIASYETAMAQNTQEQRTTARLAHKLGSIYHRLGEWEQAESYYRASADAMRPDDIPGGEAGACARLYADWSLTAHQRNQPDRACEMAERALELAEEAGDLPALAQAHNILGILARSQNQLAEAILHLERSLALAEEMDELGARIAALNNLSLAYAASGDLEKAITHTRQALELCAQFGDRHREAALHNNLADLYHAAGNEDGAMVHLKQAVVIFSEVGGDRSGEIASRRYPEIWKMTEW